MATPATQKEPQVGFPERSKFEKRLAVMQIERSAMDVLAQDIRSFIAPRTARFNGEKPNRQTREDSSIINTTARLSLRVLGNGMMSGITSPARPWFRLTTPDPEMMENEEVKAWLYDVENILRKIFAQSNLYTTLPTLYRAGLGAYGTGAMSIEDHPTKVVHFSTYPYGQYYIATSPFNVVDTFYREMSMTVSQMIERFGDKVSAAVRAMYDRGDYDQWIPVCQAIEPNYGRDPNSMLAHNKKWRSVYWEAGSKQDGDGFLRKSGFNSFPMMCPRWDVNGEDVWGTGPSEYALGDARGIQLLERRCYQAVDKWVSPTMKADASMRNTRTSNMPGDTVYVTGMAQGNDSYKPAYEINPRFEVLDQKIMRIEERIKEAFYYNLFMQVTAMADQPNITATQISIMRDEGMLQLGPVLERMNTECLDQIIDQTFDRAWFRGLIPPPPDVLHGVPLKIEYISILAQAQKALGIGAIERITGFVGTLMKIDPDARLKFDTMQSIDEYAMATGVPPRIIVSDEKVASAKGAMQQQQQAAMMAQIAPDIARSVKDLSQTPLEGDNALTRSLGL